MNRGRWVRSAGGSSIESGQGVALDGNGNVYISGTFIETTRFENKYATSAGSSDIFISIQQTEVFNG